VYFIQDSSGFVKIGWTKNLKRRFSALRTGNPSVLTVIRTLEGYRALEIWLHEQFSTYRVRGEWFRFDERMLTITPPDVFPSKGNVKQLPVRQVMEPATSIIEKLGGVSKVIEITGKHPTRVYAWMKPKNKGGTDGIIPFSHVPDLLSYAKDNRIKLKADDFLPTSQEQA